MDRELPSMRASMPPNNPFEGTHPVLQTGVEDRGRMDSLL